MADFPVLGIWTDAYLADTTHLTTTQHGAYFLLLMAAWRSPTCSLPNDDRRLAGIVKMDLRRWQQQKGPILEFWQQEGGLLMQKRLSSERKKAEELREQKRKAGLASAGKRFNERSTLVERSFNIRGNGT
jgi:uncharacterized protein YdaU (DUF1376 family)